MKQFMKLLLNKLSNKHEFEDGSRLIWLHRYALRYVKNNNEVDIGFEISIKDKKFDKIVHFSEIKQWNDGGLISSEDMQDLKDKLIMYCVNRNIKYKIV